jgi:hypothetical protein
VCCGLCSGCGGVVCTRIVAGSRMQGRRVGLGRVVGKIGGGRWGRWWDVTYEATAAVGGPFGCTSGVGSFWAKSPKLGCVRLVLGAPLEKVEVGDGEWCRGAVYKVTVVMGSHVQLRKWVWRVLGQKP